MIGHVLSRVNALSAGGPGWTRPSYSDLESAAHAVVEQEAIALGLEVTRDPAGNLFARMAGADRAAPALYTGSHLDTVAQGGAYDGQAGVAGALALAAAFRASRATPPTDIVVTVTRAEESVWFPVSYIGSRAALGRLAPEDLQACRVDSGRSLAAHMADQGYDAQAVLTHRPPAPARFLEFHIEQGPVLHQAGEPYAIVTAIRGGLRYRTAQVQGIWAHSGGADLTVTFGRVDAAGPGHAMAKVAGELGFCLDLRSGDMATLEAADAALKAEITRIETSRPGIRFDLGPQSRSQPAALSSDLANWITAGAALLGDNPRRMLSGGGHDAAAFAAAGWDSVMVFLRNDNGSHCPDEAMQESDLARAVTAVYAALMEGRT